MRDNYGLMKYFFDMIGEFARSNPDKEITENFIYSQLIKFNIPDNKGPFQDVSNNFEYIKDYYRRSNNIDVFQQKDKKYFLWFTNGKIRGNEIKMYIPLDINHIVEGTKQIFDFISSTNMEHQSKIASVVRNDDLVIRVNKMEDAQKIIDYVSGNQYIQEGMLKVNPFVPNCNGIGLTMDNTYSFNSTISSAISEYLQILRNKDRLDLFNVEGFNQYIQAKIPTIQEEDLKDIYKLLYKTTSVKFELTDFIEHANDKLSDKYTQKRERITDPKYYFEQAIIKTYKKYPQNINAAIKNYLTGNPNYFTNDEKTRDGLKKYVHPGDIINTMRSKLVENNIVVPNTDEELISNYTKIVLKDINIENNNSLDVANLYNIMKKAYVETLLKYNENQATSALLFAINDYNYNYFTGSINRETLENNFSGLSSNQILQILGNSVSLNKLSEKTNDNLIIQSFIQDCKKSIQANTPNMTR